MYAGSSDYDFLVEYMPSMASKRLKDFNNDRDQVLQNFIKVTTEETNRVRQKYKVRSNVSYAPGQGNNTKDRRIVDIYYKEKENDLPIFVYIHGGYWQELDNSSSGSFVAPLLEHGYRVLVVDYNICPQVTLAEIMEQTWSFFIWLSQYAKETNAPHISFAGHSAGAHLALVFLKQKEFIELSMAKLIRNVFLISGVYDLRELWNLDYVNPNNIFGLNSADAAKELSPYCWTLDNTILRFLHDHAIIFHILVGKHESNTFVGQSKELAKKFIGVELKAHYELFENNDHFDIIEEMPINGSEINNYVLNNL